MFSNTAISGLNWCYFIQLETAHFHHVPLAGLLRYLLREAVTYIAHHSHVIIRFLQQVVSQLRCRALPVAACYGYYFAVAFVPVAKFYFAAHLDTRIAYPLSSVPSSR